MRTVLSALLTLLTIVTIAACSKGGSDQLPPASSEPSSSSRPVSKSSELDCGSQRFATIALGDALGYVRAARIFAEAEDRRLALARLESLMIDQIQAEPDKDVREAAWKYADRQFIIKTAKAQRDSIDEGYVRTGDRRSLEERLAFYYRLHLEDATKLVDPRSPKECAFKTWQQIHAAALDAAAR